MAILKNLIVNGVTRVIGDLTATKIIKQGGISSEFLKADGSADSTSYYHSGNLTSSVIGNLGTLSNNISGNAATASNVDWGGITNKPSSFIPSNHTHTTSQITDFPLSLPANGGNADTVDGFHASSFYKYKYLRSDQNSIYDLRWNYGTYDKGDFNGTYKDEYPTYYGAYLALTYNDKNSGALMFFNTPINNTLGHIYVRTRGAGDSNTTYSEWGTLAYLTDNVASASKWVTARTINLTGSVTGSVSIDGSGDVSLATTTNHTHTKSEITDFPTIPSYSTATSDTLGLVKIGYTANNKNYPVQLSDDGKMYVNVPWTDTTYNFSGTTFYSGNSNTAEHDANNAVNNGHYYYTSNGPSISLESAPSDGALYVQSYSNYRVAQIAQDYKDGRLFVRGINNGAWQPWKKIAITGESQPANGGNADYATSAGSASSASKWSTLRKITLTGSVTGYVTIDGSKDVSLVTTTNHTHNYLPLSGGIMDDHTSRIIWEKVTSSTWVKGRDNAVLCMKDISSDSYSPFISLKTTNRSWEIGTYDSTSYPNYLIFSSVTDEDYNNGNDKTTGQICFGEGVVYANSFVGNISWNNVQDIPSSFKPADHTHKKSEITDFPTSLPANGGTSRYVTVSTNTSSSSRNILFHDGNAIYSNTYLTVNPSSGNVTSSGHFYANSDIRYKNIIEYHYNLSDKIAQLPIIKYKWTDRDDDSIRIGSSAQSVMSIIPELVSYDDNTDFYSLDYATLGAVAGISACKEVEILKQKIKELEQEIIILKSKYNG